MPNNERWYGNFENRGSGYMTQAEMNAEVRNRHSGRVDQWETVPVHMQDSGANDEGYGYEYCGPCGRVAEHDSCGNCIECDYDY